MYGIIEGIGQRRDSGLAEVRVRDEQGELHNVPVGQDYSLRRIAVCYGCLAAAVGRAIRYETEHGILSRVQPWEGA